MITYIIVDDEPLAHELIAEFCDALPHLHLKKNCYDAFEALQFLNQHTVDIMFLDINMPKLTGFDLLKTLNHPPKVIVTTAYLEFALEGYELNIADYLLKPFSFERLVKAVNKAIAPAPTKKQVEKSLSPQNTRFFVKGDKKYHQLNSEDILFIEAYGNYTKLFLKSEMIVSHENITYYESFLNSDAFLRVHKSFIVALDKINFIEGNRIQVESHKIPIGQTYKLKVSRLYNK